LFLFLALPPPLPRKSTPRALPFKQTKTTKKKKLNLLPPSTSSNHHTEKPDLDSPARELDLAVFHRRRAARDVRRRGVDVVGITGSRLGLVRLRTGAAPRTAAAEYGLGALFAIRHCVQQVGFSLAKKKKKKKLESARRKKNAQQMEKNKKEHPHIGCPADDSELTALMPLQNFLNHHKLLCQILNPTFFVSQLGRETGLVPSFPAWTLLRGAPADGTSCTPRPLPTPITQPPKSART
jgi:hypothetical protein